MKLTMGNVEALMRALSPPNVKCPCGQGDIPSPSKEFIAPGEREFIVAVLRTFKEHPDFLALLSPSPANAGEP